MENDIGECVNLTYFKSIVKTTRLVIIYKVKIIYRYMEKSYQIYLIDGKTNFKVHEWYSWSWNFLLFLK